MMVKEEDDIHEERKIMKERSVVKGNRRDRPLHYISCLDQEILLMDAVPRLGSRYHLQ
jgi:hypothetical protein